MYQVIILENQINAAAVLAISQGTNAYHRVLDAFCTIYKTLAGSIDIDYTITAPNPNPAPPKVHRGVTGLFKNPLKNYAIFCATGDINSRPIDANRSQGPTSPGSPAPVSTRAPSSGFALIKTNPTTGKTGITGQSEIATILQKLGYFKNISFDDSIDQWLHYKRGHGIWEIATKTCIFNIVVKAIRKESFGYSFSAQTVDGVIKMLRSQSNHNWNSESHLLPFKNGVLDTRSMTLHDHHPKNYLTWNLDFNYMPDAGCEPIKNWLLNEACRGDKGQMDILRAYLNALLFGRTELNKMLVLSGYSGSGKGVFSRLAMKLIGHDNVVVTTLKELEGRFEGNRIFGKKLLLISDAAAYGGDVSTLKAITGGDFIRYECKGKDTARTQFKPACLTMLLTNHGGLQSNDMSSGVSRRVINAVFNFQPSHARDLDTEFEPFIPGLLNWIIAMSQNEADAILKDHASQSQALAGAQRDQFITQYPICAWLDSNIVVQKDNISQVGNAKKVTERDGDDSETIFKNVDIWLYPNYCNYCETHGLKAVSSVRFSKLLVETCAARSMLDLEFVKKTKIHGKSSAIAGLKIRTSDDDDQSPLDHKFSKGPVVKSPVINKPVAQPVQPVAVAQPVQPVAVAQPVQPAGPATKSAMIANMDIPAKYQSKKLVQSVPAPTPAPTPVKNLTTLAKKMLEIVQNKAPGSVFNVDYLAELLHNTRPNVLGAVHEIGLGMFETGDQSYVSIPQNRPIPSSNQQEQQDLQDWYEVQAQQDDNFGVKYGDSEVKYGNSVSLIY